MTTSPIRTCTPPRTEHPQPIDPASVSPSRLITDLHVRIPQKKHLRECQTPTTPTTADTSKKRRVPPPVINITDNTPAESSHTPHEYKCIIHSCTPNFPIALLNQGTPPRLTPLPGGTSGALNLGDKVVVKFAHGELGTEYRRIKVPDSPCAKSGIHPGEGTFGEFLSARIMQLWLTQCPAGILVPESAFVDLTHPEQLKIAETECFAPISRISPLIGPKATLHAFIPDCQTFKALRHAELQTLDLKTCQLMTLFDVLLLNADGNRGNLLIDPNNRFIPIDRSCILPRNAESSLVSCTAHLPQVQQPMHPTIRRFIVKTLSADSLRILLKKMQNIPDAKNFDQNRLEMHKWAVSLVKAGTLAHLSLSEIASLFTALPTDEDYEARSIFYVLISGQNKNTYTACRNCIRLFQVHAKNRADVIHSLEAALTTAQE